MIMKSESDTHLFKKWIKLELLGRLDKHDQPRQKGLSRHIEDIVWIYRLI